MLATTLRESRLLFNCYYLKPFNTTGKRSSMKFLMTASGEQSRLFLRVQKNGQRKRATCLTTLLQNELNIDVARFTTHIKPVNNLICCKTGLMLRVVKRTTSLFNSFYSNVARRVARFLLPVFPYLKTDTVRTGKIIRLMNQGK